MRVSYILFPHIIYILFILSRADCECESSPGRFKPSPVSIFREYFMSFVLTTDRLKGATTKFHDTLLSFTWF